jgi:hypothetical protein
VSGNAACNSGVLTFTASVTNSANQPVTGCKFEFLVNGVSQGAASTTNTFTLNPCSGTGGINTACRRVSVKVSECPGGCRVTNEPAITVSQCVQTTLNCTP